MTITKAKHFPALFHRKSTKPFGFQRFSMGLGFTCARALPQTCKPSQRPDILPEAKSCSKHQDLLYFDAIRSTDHTQSISEASKCVFRLLRKPKNPRKSIVFISSSMTVTINHTFEREAGHGNIVNTTIINVRNTDNNNDNSTNTNKTE